MLSRSLSHYTGMASIFFVEELHHSLQPKAQGLNGNSYEPTKVLVSDMLRIRVLKSFICSWKIFQLKLFQLEG